MEVFHAGITNWFRVMCGFMPFPSFSDYPSVLFLLVAHFFIVDCFCFVLLCEYLWETYLVSLPSHCIFSSFPYSTFSPYPLGLLYPVFLGVFGRQQLGTPCLL
ncbi:hypothetical protein SK128_014509 [Halocaridina rubra]|uniref:Uncharacterized protein n=1 Tax=Halocaridina rubra TaxID=373956 RepID=A0AAN8XA51_HALRR